MNTFRQLKDGFLAPLWGAKFLFTHPKILGLAALPTAINFFIYAILSYFAYSNFSKILTYVTVQPQLWYQYLLYYLVGVILALLILAIMIFSFTMVGNLIASPFNDVITKKVHLVLGGKEISDTGSGLSYIFKDLSRMTNVEIKKILFSLSVTAVALIGTMILPVLAFVGWTVTVVLLAFQFIDYSLEINKLSFSSRISFIFRKIFLMISFGFSCSLFIAIPVIGFLFLPFAVIGAAKLYYQYRD